MKARLVLWLATAGSLVGACEANESGQAKSSAQQAKTEQAAPRTRPPSNPAPAPSASEPAAPRYILAGNGLQPGLIFGMKQDAAIAAATKAFGPATGKEHNDECGEGPMDFVSFHGLSLGFQEGRLAGWSLSEKQPNLRTASGLAIGAPRAVLGDAAIDKESTLGPEFSIAEVGGLLDDKEKEIVALWAGFPCQFR